MQDPLSSLTEPGGVQWVKPDKQAEALAVVTTMRDELHDAHMMIDQLKVDLHICRENSNRIDEERRRYRAEALVFRSKLIQLATTLANVHLTTQAAADILKTVEDLTTHAETPTTEVLHNMERTLIPTNEFTDDDKELENLVASLPQGPRVDPR